jgi:hypothetical protein
MTPHFRPRAALRRLTGVGVAAQPALVGCPAWGSFPCRTLAPTRDGEALPDGAGLIGLNLSGVTP